MQRILAITQSKQHLYCQVYIRVTYSHLTMYILKT